MVLKRELVMSERERVVCAYGYVKKSGGCDGAEMSNRFANTRGEWGFLAQDIVFWRVGELSK